MASGAGGGRAVCETERGAAALARARPIVPIRSLARIGQRRRRLQRQGRGGLRLVLVLVLRLDDGPDAPLRRGLARAVVTTADGVEDLRRLIVRDVAAAHFVGAALELRPIEELQLLD